MTLSAVVITKNEAANIARCLESLRFADEVVVVDSFSTDATVSVARELGARVVQRAWPGYGQQKNHAVSLAEGPWILAIDADEVVPPQLAEEIQRVIRGEPTHAAYKMPRKLFFLGRWLRWGGTYPDYQLRLFQKAAARFDESPVHERLIVNGTLGKLACPLEHYSYKDLADCLNRLNLYTTLDGRRRVERGAKFRYWHALRLPLSFVKRYVLQLGVLDGYHGYLWSVLCAFYDFIKFAKMKADLACP